MYAEDNNQIEWSIDMLLSDTRVENFSNENWSWSDDSLILISPSWWDNTIALETITSSISWADNQSELSWEFMWTPLPIDKEYEEDNTSHEQIDDVSDNNDKIVVSTSSASIVSDTEQRTVVVDNDIVTIIWK